MIIAGIDPGLEGALAVADIRKDNGGQFQLAAVLRIEDLPIGKYDNGDLIDVRKLTEILGEYEPRIISMEWPGPRTSKTSNGTPKTEWRFALGCGATLAACQLITPMVVLYAPITWKSALKVTSNKMTSVELARSLVDQETRKLFLKSRHDRAEAFLLIEHVRRLLNAGKRLVIS